MQTLISQCPAILSSEVLYDQRTKCIGFIKGTMIFLDGSELHFREFVDIETQMIRYTYAYHYY